MIDIWIVINSSIQRFKLLRGSECLEYTIPLDPFTE